MILNWQEVTEECNEKILKGKKNLTSEDLRLMSLNCGLFNNYSVFVI